MIFIVLGTLAQTVKMAPVIRELDRRKLHYRFVSTQQHQENLEDIVADFGLRPPDVKLWSGAEMNQVRGAGAWMVGVRRAWKKYYAQSGASAANSVVVVHGNTTSALLGAWLGRRSGLPVAQVEAGLRSGHWFKPFPEAIQQELVSRWSQILFCPGAWAVNNVAWHRRHAEIIDTLENTLIDSLRYALANQPAPSQAAKSYLVVSVRRFETVTRGGQLRRALDLFHALSGRYDLHVLLHPATKKALERRGWLDELTRLPRTKIFPRMPYTDFIGQIANATAVLTDGGSNQEESSFLGIPCLILREVTERPHGLGENARLTGLDQARILGILEHVESFRRPRRLDGPSPSSIIVDRLETYGQQ